MKTLLSKCRSSGKLLPDPGKPEPSRAQNRRTDESARGRHECPRHKAHGHGSETEPRANLCNLVLLLFLSAVTAAAQTGPRGGLTLRVIDPSGSAVPDAQVTLTHRTTRQSVQERTNSSGERALGELAPGEYVLEVEAEGFGSSAPRVITIDSGSTATLEVQLEIARVASSVQVTATGTPQTVDEISKALDIVNLAEIEGRAEYSVPETIRTTPGIRVQQLGGPGALVRIIARGMRPSDTSILIDGYRFRDAASPQGDASAFAGDLLTTSVSRIEILRGSGSSLYGTHATAGVINVITDPGGGSFHGEIGAEGGGLSMARGYARFGGSALEERFRYSGSLNHLNVMKGIDGDDRARNSVGHIFLHGQVGLRTALQGRILASDSFAQLNDSPFAAPASSLPPTGIVKAVPYVTFIPAPDDPDSRRTAGYFSGLASITQALSSRATARVAYQYVSTRRDNRDGPAGNRFEPEFNNSNRFDGRSDIVDARLDWSNRFHMLTAGYEFEREHFDNPSMDENPNPINRIDARLRITQKNNAVFVQDQIRLFSERLLVSVSGRMQQFSLSSPVFSSADAPYSGIALPSPPRAWTGDASASYFWRSSGTKLRAHAGNSFRAPALFERFGASFFFGSFSAFGDPNLAPERIFSIDGGIDQYVFGSRVRLSGTYFYTRLQQAIGFDTTGLIMPDTDPYGRFGGYRNTGGGLARGLELSMEANPTRSLVARASYTYTNADERQSVFLGGTLQSVRISKHMWTATALQRLGRRLDVAFDLFAASDYLYGFGNRPFEFAGPVKADVAVTYSLFRSDTRAVQVFTRVENFLNRTYYEDGFPTPGAWAVGGIKVLF